MRSWQASCAMREAARLHGLAVDESRFILADAKPEEFFGLTQPVSTQFVQHVRGKSDSTGSTRLRLLVANSVPGLLGALHYGQLSIYDVDMTPAKRNDFPAPQSAEYAKNDRDEEAGVAYRF